VVLPNPQPCIYTSIKSKSLDSLEELHNGTDNTEAKQRQQIHFPSRIALRHCLFAPPTGIMPSLMT
jgi:hypothetical protein